MRRLALVLSVIIALLLTAALAVPALGGPSIGQIAKTAAKALKLAKTADKRSKRALALAKRTAAQVGQNGTNGTNGTSGTQGPPGPNGAAKIDFRADPGTGDTNVFAAGGLTITARCDAGPNLSAHATSSVDNSDIHLAGTKGTSGSPPTPVYSDDDQFGPASTPFSLPTSNFQGTLTYSTPAGAVVTVTFAAEQGAFGGTKACWLGGWALHDPS